MTSCNCNFPNFTRERVLELSHCSEKLPILIQHYSLDLKKTQLSQNRPLVETDLLLKMHNYYSFLVFITLPKK